MALIIIFYREERGTEERGSVPLFEVDHHRHASETPFPFPWRFAGVAMMEPSDMVIFQGGGGGGTHAYRTCVLVCHHTINIHAQLTNGARRHNNLSHDIRFPTIWYVRPAKAQTRLRIHAV